MSGLCEVMSADISPLYPGANTGKISFDISATCCVDYTVLISVNCSINQHDPVLAFAHAYGVIHQRHPSQN